MMAYRVDPDACIACGLCPTLAPGVFEITDAGVAEAVNQPQPGQTEQAKEAMDSCPVSAIHDD